MTLLSVVQDVCAVVGVQVPTSVFSNITNNRTMQEMLENAIEMAQRIAYDNRDWTRFRTTHTYQGDGVTTAFDLPDNFKRMLLTANVWRSISNMTPMRFEPDTDRWLQRRSQDFYDAYGEWTMLGGQMHIQPVMGGNVTAYFPYLDKNCIQNANGVGERFMSDSDSFLLDERLLKLGMIWRWKSQKGAPYSEDMGSYGDALTYAMGQDSPAPIIVGRLPISAHPRASYAFLTSVPR